MWYRGLNETRESDITIEIYFIGKKKIKEKTFTSEEVK